MMFGGGAKAFVGTGATTERVDTRGRAVSSWGSVGSSDSSLKRVAAYSTRSRGCPSVYPWSHSRQHSFFKSVEAALRSSA